MRPQPMIAVKDVEASSRWYQRLLGCESGHGGKEYERLVCEGELILQLLHLGTHDEPAVGHDPGDARIETFSKALVLGAQVDEGHAHGWSRGWRWTRHLAL